MSLKLRLIAADRQLSLRSHAVTLGLSVFAGTTFHIALCVFLILGIVIPSGDIEWPLIERVLTSIDGIRPRFIFYFLAIVSLVTSLSLIFILPAFFYIGLFCSALIAIRVLVAFFLSSSKFGHIAAKFSANTVGYGSIVFTVLILLWFVAKEIFTSFISSFASVEVFLWLSFLVILFATVDYFASDNRKSYGELILRQIVEVFTEQDFPDSEEKQEQEQEQEQEQTNEIESKEIKQFSVFGFTALCVAMVALASIDLLLPEWSWGTSLISWRTVVEILSFIFSLYLVWLIFGSYKIFRKFNSIFT